MINKFKYVGVLSLAVMALSHTASAQDSAGLDSSQKLLFNKSIVERPMAPLELPKPVVSNWPTPASVPAVYQDPRHPVTTIPVEPPTLSNLPISVDLPEGQYPIYGSLDPETGEIIVSHTPGTKPAKIDPVIDDEVKTKPYIYHDAADSDIRPPKLAPIVEDDEAEIKSHVYQDPTHPVTTIPVEPPMHGVDEFGDVDEVDIGVNPLNTVNIKNLNHNQMAKMKESLAKKRESLFTGYKVNGQVDKISSYSPSGWKSE